MRGPAQWLTMAVVAAFALRSSEAQLLHNIKNFVSNIPTFNSPNNPTFDVQDGHVNVDVPVPDNVKFGTVDQSTGTWQLTDKSLGTGVAVGPQGAQLLTVTPSAGSTQVTQAAALGPNGLTIGPNKVDTETSQAERQAQGNLGIQNLRIGKDGLIINDGSRLNSSVQVDPQGIQLNGNPTGGGESHLYIKPNINLLGQQFGQAAPPKEPNNVQVSYGDGKSTATQQLQGYTNYQLDPSKGTVAQVPNQAPPFMGVNPNGQYRSYAGQAPAPANMAASQASTSQQQGAAQHSAAQAPVTRMQVVQTPTPRRFEYAGDLASGSPQAAAAYARQVGGSVQQAQQTMDQRQDVFNELQAKLNAQNAGRQPLAVAAPQPATQSRDFQRLAGVSDAGGSGRVTSFVQQSSAPDQAPLPYSGNAPTTAQSMGRAPGPGYSFEGEDPSLDMASFLKKEKKHHSPSPGHLAHKVGGASTVEPHHKNNATSPTPEHHHKKNGTSPGLHHHKKNATSMGAAVVGKAHTLDSETPTGVAPAEVTSAAKQEAVSSGSAKALNAVPAPLYAGGPPPSMMTSPVPQFSGPSSPTDTAAYVHGLLADKSAEVVGDTSGSGLHSWLAVSPASGADEPGSAGMPAPAQAPSQEAAPVAAPAQELASAAAPAQIKAHPFASIVPMHNLVPESSYMAKASAPAQGPDASPAEMRPLSAIVPMHVLVPATPYAAEGPAIAHAPSPAQGLAKTRQHNLQKAKALAMSAYRESLAAEMAPGPAHAPGQAPAPAGGPAEAQHQVTLAAEAIAMAAYEAEALSSDMGPSPARAPAPAAAETAPASASAGLGGRRLLGQ